VVDTSYAGLVELDNILVEFVVVELIVEMDEEDDVVFNVFDELKVVVEGIKVDVVTIVTVEFILLVIFVKLIEVEPIIVL
jgi:hypothetical protein